MAGGGRVFHYSIYRFFEGIITGGGRVPHSSIGVLRRLGQEVAGFSKKIGTGVGCVPHCSVHVGRGFYQEGAIYYIWYMLCM